jgi:hypothetical protein
VRTGHRTTATQREVKENGMEGLKRTLASYVTVLVSPHFPSLHSFEGMIGFPLTGSLSSHQLGRKGRIRTLSALEFPSTTKSDSRASSSEAKLENGLSSCNFTKANPRFESRVQRDTRQEREYSVELSIGITYIAPSSQRHQQTLLHFFGRLGYSMKGG